MDRQAEKAGSWYPDDPARLGAMVDWLLARARAERGTPPPPDPVAAVIVPHAGLEYSGPTAAHAFAWLADTGASPETIFIFGAVHRGTGYDDERGAVWPDGRWHTPLGALEVDVELAADLVAADVARADVGPHAGDNAIELTLPFIARLFPTARIVPVGQPAKPEAVEAGRRAQAAASRRGRRVLAVGSTDLTHYGVAFGVMPAGAGPGAVAWTRRNSTPFLDALAGCRWEDALEFAQRDGSACGAGAAVSAGSFAEASGARGGVVAAHLTSAEATGEEAHTEHLVDYASVVYSIGGV